MTGLVDDAHATTANFGDDFVGADLPGRRYFRGLEAPRRCMRRPGSARLAERRELAPATPSQGANRRLAIRAPLATGRFRRDRTSEPAHQPVGLRETLERGATAGALVQVGRDLLLFRLAHHTKRECMQLLVDGMFGLWRVHRVTSQCLAEPREPASLIT